MVLSALFDWLASQINAARRARRRSELAPPSLNPSKDLPAMNRASSLPAWVTSTIASSSARSGPRSCSHIVPPYVTIGRTAADDAEIDQDGQDRGQEIDSAH